MSMGGKGKGEEKKEKGGKKEQEKKKKKGEKQRKKSHGRLNQGPVVKTWLKF